MIDRTDFEKWVIQALTDLGGEGRIAEICKYIWAHHEPELRASSNHFYTWQYEVLGQGNDFVTREFFAQCTAARANSGNAHESSGRRLIHRHCAYCGV